MTEVIKDVRLLMTPEQRDRLNEEPAWTNTKRVMGFPLGATPFQMTGHFHQVMGLPAPETPILPPVSMRERRLRLIFEEFLELTEACGFELLVNDDSETTEVTPGYVRLSDSIGEKFKLAHIEGSRYDVVECADALGDLNVVVAGTGVEFGIPMHFVDYEIYTSNLSKLNVQDGKPIVNICRKCGPNPDNIYYSTCECGNTESFIDQSAPIGKILKPDSYTPPNIPRVLLAYQEKEI